MAEVKVKALRDFRNANVGSKTKGETFDYDVEKDPDGLVKLGVVAGPKPEAKA